MCKQYDIGNDNPLATRANRPTISDIQANSIDFDKNRLENQEVKTKEPRKQLTNFERKSILTKALGRGEIDLDGLTANVIPAAEQESNGKKSLASYNLSYSDKSSQTTKVIQYNDEGHPITSFNLPYTPASDITPALIEQRRSMVVGFFGAEVIEDDGGKRQNERLTRNKPNRKSGETKQGTSATNKTKEALPDIDGDKVLIRIREKLQ